jgi:hypothetical protein
VVARTIHTSIEIDAPADRVWDILINFDDHPKWNPFIPRIQGQAVKGSQLKVFFKISGNRRMFRPKVINCEPRREFRWKGIYASMEIFGVRILFVPGLIDGERSFQVNPIGNDRVEFVQQETFSGLVVGLLFGAMGAFFQQGFEAMNQALKTQAEGGTSG